MTNQGGTTMQYKTHNQDDLINVTGTWLLTTINLPFYTVVGVLGDPMRFKADEGDGKVRVEWDIQFEDGLVATIYDWKEHNRAPEEVTDWHIGGRGFEVVQRVYDLLGSKNTSLTY